MHKAFNLQIGLFCDFSYFFYTKLSGCHHTCDAFLFQKFRSIHTGDRHLCTGMDRKIRKCLSDKPEYPDVLHDHRIQPLTVIGIEIRIKLLFQLLFLQKCINSQIELLTVQMHKIDCFQKFVFRKIIRICAGTEHHTSGINRIRSCSHSCFQTIHRPCRCQNLHLLPHTNLL